MSSFTPAQLTEIQRMILSVTTDAQKGRYPGFGNPQVDTYNYPDNCTASFPWNFDFVIPKNFQRWTSVHLSFKLRSFRGYESGVVGPAGIHYHTWVTSGAGALNWTLGMDSGGNPKIGGAASPPPYGYQTGTDVGTGAAANSAFTTVDVAGAGHTHPLTITYGIFESTSPTSVTIKIDGTDYTSRLAGPWTTDTVELDITKVMPTATGVFHTISLTPNQNGRITGELRFSYFVDGSVAA